MRLLPDAKPFHCGCGMSIPWEIGECDRCAAWKRTETQVAHKGGRCEHGAHVCQVCDVGEEGDAA